MDPDRPSVSRIGDRPVTRWRREQEPVERPQSFSERPSSGVARPYSKMERPTSRRGIKTDITEYGISRPPTSGRNVLSRPPSATMANRVPTPSSRLHTMNSANLSRANSGLPRHFIQPNAMILDRPITQQGLAGVRIGSSRGVPKLNRQIEDKMYYKQLLQLKIQELNQEITSITNEVEKQNKDTFSHYDHRAKEVASELTEVQDQLVDYNFTLDKMTVGVDKKEIELDARELKELHEFEKSELERISNKRQLALNKLNELSKQIEAREKIADRFVEMDAETRQKYNEAQKQKAQLQKEVDALQAEYNQVSAKRSKLEQKIASSPIKQEACKLFMKIFEAEQKREKLLEEKYNLSSDDMAEKQIIEIQKKIADAEEELQQLETNSDEGLSEKQTKYSEFKKQDNKIENFATLDKNKEEELEKLNRLEELVVEKLEHISNSINENIDTSILNDDEMEMIQTLMNQDFENRSEKDFEELKQDSIKICQTLRKLEMLEAKISERTGKVKTADLAISDDSESNKDVEKKQRKLLLHKQDINGQEKKINEEFDPIKNNFNKLAELFEQNEMYRSISILEDKLEKVKFENDQFDQPNKEDIENLDKASLMEKLFSLTAQYNAVLINEMKSIY